MFDLSHLVAILSARASTHLIADASMELELRSTNSSSKTESGISSRMYHSCGALIRPDLLRGLLRRFRRGIFQPKIYEPIFRSSSYLIYRKYCSQTFASGQLKLPCLPQSNSLVTVPSLPVVKPSLKSINVLFRPPLHPLTQGLTVLPRFP